MREKKIQDINTSEDDDILDAELKDIESRSGAEGAPEEIKQVSYVVRAVMNLKDQLPKLEEKKIFLDQEIRDRQERLEKVMKDVESAKEALNATR